MKLSATEKKILKSVERDEWRSVPRLIHERTRYVRIAKATRRRIRTARDK
jgi:hypothetical protein